MIWARIMVLLAGLGVLAAAMLPALKLAYVLTASPEEVFNTTVRILDLGGGHRLLVYTMTYNGPVDLEDFTLEVRVVAGNETYANTTVVETLRPGESITLSVVYRGGGEARLGLSIGFRAGLVTLNYGVEGLRLGG